MAKSTGPFRILEATIDDIHSAYQSGHLTCRQLVQMYLDRIEAFDKKGPAINAIITIVQELSKTPIGLTPPTKLPGSWGRFTVSQWF